MENTVRGVAGNRGDERAAAARDFVNRYTTGDPTEGYSDEEARLAVQEVLPKLNKDQLNRALAASAANMQSNMKESDRTALAKMLEQRQQGEGMVDITRTGEVVPAGTSGDAESPAAASLDDVLGGLLGGSGDSGLGDVLGGLLGGGAQGGSGSPNINDVLSGMQDQQPGSQPDSDGGGGLGDVISGFMGSTMGKTLMAGAAAFAMKELFDQD